MKTLKTILCLAMLHGHSAWSYERLQGPTQVTYWDRTKTADGYTLFGALGTTYLIDMEGCVVKSWPLGINPKLLDNGHLLDATNGTINGFQALEELDWNGSNVWNYVESRTNYFPHHDFLRIYNKKLGTNTTLYLANKSISYAQCIATGCDPAASAYTNVTVDAIVEVDASGTVIWEWCFFDHGCQNFDAGKSNYVASISGAPGRINLNLPGRPLTNDWLHCTSLDYNTNLDQIVVSAEGGEFYVLDHGNTFTAGNPAASIAAAASTNGDFIYRFGDPARYGAGTTPSIGLNWTTSGTGQKQIGGVGQVAWIPTGLPGAGHFLVFNNGQDLFETTPQSYIFEVNGYINSSSNDTGAYVSPVSAGYFTWPAPGHDTDHRAKSISRQATPIFYSMANQAFFSHLGGGVQRLANSNLLVCSAAEGHIFEATAAGEVVWEFINPVTTNGVISYKRDDWPLANPVYRATRFSASAPALSGRTLTGAATIAGGTPTYISAPSISGVTQMPLLPSATNTVAISATITNNQNVASAALAYVVGASTTTVAMTHVGSLYSATIPANTAGTLVRYFISAADDFGNAITNTTQSYTVQASAGAPTISNLTVTAGSGSAAWLTARVGAAAGVGSVVLAYSTGGSSVTTNTVFSETMATNAIKPWTGTGCDNMWTVTYSGGNPFEQRAGSNYGAGNTNGMQFKQGTTSLTNSMVTTANGIGATGTAAYAEFYMGTAGLTVTNTGWTFQLNAGTGFVTRLSELSGTNHNFQLYHYDLQAGELASNLTMRFQFAGVSTNDKINLDLISVKTITGGTVWSNLTLLDDGLHNDGAAGDGVYGVQLPTQSAGASMSYYLVATDTGGLSSTNPVSGPAAPLAYTAINAPNLLLGRPTASGITVNALADTNLTMYISYGTASGTYTGQTSVTNLVANQPLEMTLTGLQSNTRYFYRLNYQLSGESAYHQSPECAFYTQRAPGSTFTFCMHGDTHPERAGLMFNADLYTNTLTLAAADHPDFYVLIGDDFSVDSIPTNTINQTLVTERYTIQRPWLGLVGKSSPLFLVNGNHEQASLANFLSTNLVAPGVTTVTYSNIAVWAQTARNLYYPQPAVDSFYGGLTNDTVTGIGPLRSCYAWTWGDALFITLDPYWYSTAPVDNQYGQDTHPTANKWDITHGNPQYQWLKTTLEQSTAKYKFVFAHHVMGTGRGGTEDATFYEWGGQNLNGTWGFTTNRPSWALPVHQLMASNHVTMFVQGHDHIFAREQLDGVTYLTLPLPADNFYQLYNADAFTNALYKTNSSGYVRFTVAPENVRVDYVRAYMPADVGAGKTNGMVDYSFTLSPLLITNVTATPALPFATNPVWVTAALTGTNLAQATLVYIANNTTNSVSMADDGAHQDGSAGDALFGAQIPAFAAGTVVQYYVAVQDTIGDTIRSPANAPAGLYSYTVQANLGLTIANVSTTPGTPLAGSPIWVTARVTDSASITNVLLNYNAGGASYVTNAVFTETMATNSVKPWTGTGCQNAWTVTYTGGNPFEQNANANYGSGNTNGLSFKGGTTNLTDSMVTTTSGIDARGTSGNISFYVQASVITNTAAWTMQFNPGSGFTTRLSETNAANHSYRAYSYDLLPGDLVSNLLLRFQFSSGTSSNRLFLDQLTLNLVTGSSGWTNVVMYDDGAHGDGSAGDGIFGAQIPTQSVGTVVSYYISASDNAGASTNYPTVGAGGALSFTVTNAPSFTYDVMLGRPTDNSIAISVLSTTNLQVYCQYGTLSGSYTGQTAVTNFGANTPGTLTLAALAADTQYYYRLQYAVTGATNFTAGTEHTFHTQRARGSTFVFDIEADPHYNDTAGGWIPAVWQQTLTNIMADRPDFYLDLGDTFMGEKRFITYHDTNAMTQAGILDAALACRNQFFNIPGHSVPLFLVNGNHDPELGWWLTNSVPHDNSAVWGAMARDLYYPCPIPGSFYSGATNVDYYQQTARDAYYAFEWGNALFVVLDPYWYSNQATTKSRDPWSWTLGTNQYYWLKSTLEKSTTTFKFVFAHHLVGGNFGNDGRGGLEFAKYFEWGGYNTNDTWGFTTNRPGWPMPIQNLLLANGVQAFFHGHDHLYVKQDYYAGGVTNGQPDLIYQEVPQPSHYPYDSIAYATGTNVDYNYQSGVFFGSSGHLRITVSPTNAMVEYVRSYRPSDEGSGKTNRMVSYAYSLTPFTNLTISGVTATPTPPLPTNAVWVTATLPSTNVTQVALTYIAGGVTNTTMMLDDGAHHDGTAADATFGAQIPALPGGTVVNYFITAQDNAGRNGSYPSGAPTNWLSYTVLVSNQPPQIVSVSTSPTIPTAGNATWIRARLTDDVSVASVLLNYTGVTTVTNIAFLETMATNTVKPWTGSGCNFGWTVSYTGGNPFEQNANANYGAGNTNGLSFKGGTTNLTDSYITTANGIDARGSSGTLSFYVQANVVTGYLGWAMQLNSGTGFSTRVSETANSNHNYRAYSYTLQAGELVSNLMVRFQFSSSSVSNRTFLDQIALSLMMSSNVTTSVAMFDDGLHGDLAAGDGYYGAQIPAQAAGATVSYYVTALDGMGSTNANPGGAPGTQYSFVVTNAVTPPAFTPQYAYVPGGSFIMGDHFEYVDLKHYTDEVPLHPVYISPLYMGTTLVTCREYCEFLNDAVTQGLVEVRSGMVYTAGGTNVLFYTYDASVNSRIQYAGGTFTVLNGRDLHPATSVRWFGAIAYCNWLSGKNAYDAAYNLDTGDVDFSKNGFRLPTEAEWEYAAHGGPTDTYTMFPWGNNTNADGSFANWQNSGDPFESTDAYPCTTPVGFYDGSLRVRTYYNWPGSQETYQTSDGSNPLGLYDMGGNVWEWCNDWYMNTYYSYCTNNNVVTNPPGPSLAQADLFPSNSAPNAVAYRCLRGGTWWNGNEVNDYDYGHARVSNRDPSFYLGGGPAGDANSQWSQTGFRVMRPDKAAQTVGLFLNTSNASPGYVLMSPMQGTNTYLINNAGQIVHQWTSQYNPGRADYLLENGHLLRGCGIARTVISTGGGEGGRLEERDWAGNLVWAYEMNTSSNLTHHDFKMLPNGNVLMLAVEVKSYAECIAAGFKSNLLDSAITTNGGFMLPDYVIEVQPTRPFGGNIVWEWHPWDHLVQDADITKNNYGNVSNNVQLIDPNGGSVAIKIPQFWNHMNSLDYNAEFDQISLSVRGNSELWVIDHSTTTAQAAGHTGGKYGKGGDLLYRWGDARQYKLGTVANRFLYQQHDVSWIPNNYPGGGHILIHNNGIGRNYTSIDEIVPPVDAYGNYTRTAGAAFGPTNLYWTYTNNPATSLYSSEISGAQRQPNGNTLICAGIFGTLFEVTPSGATVWRYINPEVHTPLAQGDVIPIDPNMTNQWYNSVFKVHRYATNYPGLLGKDLTPHGTIETYTGTTTDSLGLGLPDIWVRAHFGSLSGITTNSDHDADGLTDRTEYLLGIDPTKASSTGDGVPDGWKVTYGLDPSSLTATAAKGANALTYQQSYFADLNPTNAASQLRLIDIDVIGTNIFVTWMGGNAAWQCLEYTTDLTAPNTWQPLFTNTPPTYNTNTLLHTGAGVGSNRFYRIKAWR